MRAFYLLSSPFNGAFRAGEGNGRGETESKDDAKEQQKHPREDRLWVLLGC